MTEMNSAQWKTKPFHHQVEGVKALIRHRAFGLFDEQGNAKSKQVIDAACELNLAELIRSVVVVEPAMARTTWLDPELSEVQKHIWRKVVVYEFTAGKDGPAPKLVSGDPKTADLIWVVVNYEFLRSKRNWSRVVRALRNPKLQPIMIVCDESSFIKTRTAQQTKAVMKLRPHCARAVILNGTPVTNSPLDLWSQMNFLDRSILGRYDNFYHFRNAYCEMGGWNNKQVLRYHDLDKLSAIVAPYVLRREKKDCLDLPEKLFTAVEVRLTPASWRRYCQLRDEAILSLEDIPDDVTVVGNAATRQMRLTQLTSGLLGGVPVEPGAGPLFGDPDPDDEPQFKIVPVSSEKLDWMVDEFLARTGEVATIVWCRFRLERERLAQALRATPQYRDNVFEMFGGQNKNDRATNVKLFSDAANYNRRMVLLAQPHAAGLSLSLVAATFHTYLSHDYSSFMRKQSEDRSHRPGQLFAVTYRDVIAAGPAGQRTVDHAIVRALRRYEDVARWTASAWRKALVAL